MIQPSDCGNVILSIIYHKHNTYELIMKNFVGIAFNITELKSGSRAIYFQETARDS